MMNTEFRKQATNEFEKNFTNLSKTVFWKTMENALHSADFKIVHSDEKERNRKLIASQLIWGCTHFCNSLAGFSMHREKLRLNKPVCAGMTILDNSKILMNNIFYNTLKKQYNARCELIYTDTDSLLLEIQNDDVYKDMEDKSICTTQAINQ